MPTLEGQIAWDFKFLVIFSNFVRVPLTKIHFPLLKMRESPAECGRVGNYVHSRELLFDGNGTLVE